MLTDSQLTETVRRCPCSIPKNGITASFFRSEMMSFRWLNSTEDKLHIYVPDYLQEAPERVIMDLTKKIIQHALYDSDSNLTYETKEWLIADLHSEDNVRKFILRNGFTEVRSYLDAIIVTSEGDVIDSFPLFRVISVPKDKVDSEEMIQELYSLMIEQTEQYLEV